MANQSLGEQKLIACAKLAHAYEYLNGLHIWEIHHWPRMDAAMAIMQKFYTLAGMPMNDFMVEGKYDLEDTDVKVQA